VSSLGIEHAEHALHRWPSGDPTDEIADSGEAVLEQPSICFSRHARSVRTSSASSPPSDSSCAASAPAVIR
jgi:hypothetical protein